MGTGRGARGRFATVLVVAALIATGCRDGGSDVDIDEAARALEEAAFGVLSAVAPDGDVTVDVEVRPCIDALNRDTGEFMAVLGPNSVVTGADLGEAPVADIDERVRQALVAHGFEIDPDFPGDYIAGDRDDDIKLSVIAQPPMGAVAATGTTGCRPPA